MAIGNTGVSSLLRSANSAANALQTLQDTQAAYEWEFGPQDQAAHDKYSSYLQGRYSKLSGSSNPADLTKSIDFQKKLIDTDRTFRSNQIQLSTLATLNGSGSDLQKVDLLKNLAQQAYQNGDVQNGQSIEMMYDHALQALETKTTGGSSGGSFGSSSGALTASQTKTADQNKIDIALANVERAYQTGKPLAGTDANGHPTGQPAIGKDGKPVYITPNNYGQLRQTAIVAKAQSYLDQINSGNDKEGTNLKGLTDLYNNTDFKKTGMSIEPNADGTLSIKQTGPAQGVYDAQQNTEGTAFKFDPSTGTMKAVPLGGTRNTLLGPDGKPIQGVGGSALSTTIYDRGRTSDKQFIYPRASSTTPGSPSELTFLDATQPVNPKDAKGLLVGRDPKTGAYVLVGKNQQNPDGTGAAYHQVLLGDNGKPIYNAKDALAAAKKTNDYVTNSNEGVAPTTTNILTPAKNSAKFIENGVGAGVKSAIGELGKLGTGADRFVSEAGLNPGNVGNFLANPLVGFEGIGHSISNLLGLSHGVQTQQQIHQQQIQAAWQATQQHIQAQQAQAQRAAQQQQLYQQARAAQQNAAKPGPRIQLTPAQQFASVAGPNPTAQQSARALQPALGLNYDAMLSHAGLGF